MNKVLIVEDDSTIRARAQIDRLLQSIGIQSDWVKSLNEALQQRLSDYSLILSELELHDGPGTDLIKIAGNCPVLIMTSHTSLQTAVDSMRKGAVDYITKPIDNNELQLAIERILNANASTALNATESKPTDQNQTKNIESLPGMIGTSDAMAEVYQRICKVATTTSTVLIRGETGTGKELVARAVHQASSRAEQPFVAVNCAAIPETLIESELFGHEKGAFTGAASKRSGLIEAAEGGTLFLDEIGELPSEAQARLLRFIQEGEIRRVGSNAPQKVDVRLVVATHRDLRAMTKTSEFRADLYYRINVFRIFLPALRQRGSDLLEIAEHLLRLAAMRHDKEGLYLLPDAIQAMTSYDWPGNVRELENVIERAAIMVDRLGINRHTLEIDMDLADINLVNAETLTPFSVNTAQEDWATSATRASSAMARRPSVNDPQEDLSLEDYFQRFVLENQEQMNETELAKKLGISRKCLWERRQRFSIPRQKASKTSSDKH